MFSAVTLVTFTYAIITFRRVLKYDDYNLANDIKRGNDLELGNSVQIFATGTPVTRKAPNGVAVAVEDTSYQSQTQSLGSTALKSHIDRAVGVEFGWGSGAPTAGRVERSDSFVGSKLVQSRTAQSSQVVRRASDRGVVLEEEGDEEDDDVTVRGSHDGGRQVLGHRREGSDDDTRALLGGHEGMVPFMDQLGR